MNQKRSSQGKELKQRTESKAKKKDKKDEEV